jgi:hypothetical protein
VQNSNDWKERKNNGNILMERSNNDGKGRVGFLYDVLRNPACPFMEKLMRIEKHGTG